MKAVSVIAALALSSVPVAAVNPTAGNSTAGNPTPYDLVTHCVGLGGAVTVPGDLLVPAGQTCSLDGTVVVGDVHVEPGANLLVHDGTFASDVIVAADGYLDAIDTAVDGGIRNDTAYGTYLESSTVSGAFRATGSADAAPFLVAQDVAFDDLVRTSGGSLELTSSVVQGDVQGLDGQFADLLDTVVTGNLRVRGNAHGSLVCQSEVDGLGQVDGNAGPVQLGGGGQLGDCAASGYWGAGLQVADNTGSVEVTDNIVRADLFGNGNDPAPVGGDNRVRGEARGQFSDLQPGHAAAPGLGANSPIAVRDGLEQDRSDRLEQARQEAQRLGPADF